MATLRFHHTYDYIGSALLLSTIEPNNMLTENAVAYSINKILFYLQGAKRVIMEFYLYDTKHPNRYKSITIGAGTTTIVIIDMSLGITKVGSTTYYDNFIQELTRVLSELTIS